MMRKKGLEDMEYILSNLNSLNLAILRAFEVIPEVSDEKTRTGRGRLAA
jgi:hypothetical protein